MVKKNIILLIFMLQCPGTFAENNIDLTLFDGEKTKKERFKNNNTNNDLIREHTAVCETTCETTCEYLQKFTFTAK